MIRGFINLNLLEFDNDCRATSSTRRKNKINLNNLDKIFAPKQFPRNFYSSEFDLEQLKLQNRKRKKFKLPEITTLFTLLDEKTTDLIFQQSFEENKRAMPSVPISKNLKVFKETLEKEIIQLNKENLEKLNSLKELFVGEIEKETERLRKKKENPLQVFLENNPFFSDSVVSKEKEVSVDFSQLNYLPNFTTNNLLQLKEKLNGLFVSLDRKNKQLLNEIKFVVLGTVSKLTMVTNQIKELAENLKNFVISLYTCAPNKRHVLNMFLAQWMVEAVHSKVKLHNEFAEAFGWFLALLEEKLKNFVTLILEIVETQVFSTETRDIIQKNVWFSLFLFSKFKEDSVDISKVQTIFEILKTSSSELLIIVMLERFGHSLWKRNSSLFREFVSQLTGLIETYSNSTQNEVIYFVKKTKYYCNNVSRTNRIEKKKSALTESLDFAVDYQIVKQEDCNLKTV